MPRGREDVENPALVGRHTDRMSLVGLLADNTPDGAAVGIVMGPAGIGKTALLEAVSRAGPTRRVVVAHGARARSLMPFEVLADVAADVESGGQFDLPAPLRQVIDRVKANEPADGTLLRVALAALLNAAGRTSPLLVLIDDLHDVDPGSRAVLMAVTHRLRRDRVVMVCALRGEQLPPDVGDGAVRVRLAPLRDAEALALLDRQPSPPQGRRRYDVLRAAAGNPLAIIELARDASGPITQPSPRGGSVSLGVVLSETFGARLDGLPEPTRWALLLAAAGETRLQVLQAAPVGVSPTDWDPAEAAGLVAIVGGSVRFRHHLVESAVYEAEPETRRARAHAVLAAALTAEAGLVAWHRSARSPAPDESVAAVLVEYADQVLASGDSTTAALVLQRAAELSPDLHDRDTRLLQAAKMASVIGQTSWVAEIIAPILANPESGDVRVLAACLMGWLQMMDDIPEAAAEILLAELESPGLLQNPVLRDLIGTVVLPVYSTGSADAISRLDSALTRWGSVAGDQSLDVLWATTVGHPSAAVVEKVRSIAPTADLSSPEQFGQAILGGVCALVLDETQRSIEHLESVCDLLRHGPVFHAALTSFAALGWAYLDTARFTAADQNADIATEVTALAQVPVVTSVIAVQRAVAQLARGREDDAVDHARRVVAASADPALAAQLSWALGRSAAARGDHALAWSRLRALYDSAGAPVHLFVGLLAVGDLCSVGARLGRDEEGRAVLARVRRTRGWHSHRQLLIFARAEGVLDADGTATLEFAADDSQASQWPLERALCQLDLGVAHHGKRRQKLARGVLHDALAAFEHLDASEWAVQTRQQLRAAGARVAPPMTSSWSELTAQQQRIVRMAAAGSSNREIADQLHLSVRTVSSHLYRSFPKLGIASRSQLASVAIPATE